MSVDFLARMAQRALGVGDFVTPNSRPLFSGQPAPDLEEVHETADATFDTAPQLPPAQPAVAGLPQIPPPRVDRPQAGQIQVAPHQSAPAPAPGPASPLATRPLPPPVPQSVERPAAATDNQQIKRLDSPQGTPQVVVIQPTRLSADPLPPVRPAGRLEPAVRALARPQPEARPRPSRESRPPAEAPIQVSIGEVVVRLLEEKPATSRSRPAAPVPTVSLADYLRSRDGRGG